MVADLIRALRKFLRRPDSSIPKYESPVPHLLISNSPLSEGERNLIQITLTRAHEEEHALGVLSSRAPPENDNSKTPHLEQLQNFIHIHEQLLSPLRSFPAELLSLIFSFCLPDSANLSKRWSNLPAFNLIQVSKRWRAIGIDTPALWTVLPRIELNAETAVIPGSRLKTSRRRRLSFLEEVLRRSRDELLWLDIKADDDYLPAQQPVIDILARQAHRWGGLVIYSQFCTLNSICSAQQALQKLPGPPFPRLQVLGLHVTNGNLITQISWFSQTPNLRELTISGQINPQNIIVPHRQLRLYHEECIRRGVTRFTVNDVLRCCSETLESLEVFLMDRSSGPFTNPVIVEKLKHLKIRSDPRISSTRLLNDLVIPSVEYLSFEQDAGCPFPILLALIRRSVNHRQGSHPLKYLHLRVPMNGPGQLKSFLKKTPKVDTLEISMPPTQDLVAFVASAPRVKVGDLGIEVRSRSLQIVPDLKSITFYCTLQSVIGSENGLLAIANARFTYCNAICYTHSNCTLEHHKLESLRLLFDDHANLYASLGLLNRWNTAGTATVAHSRTGTPVSRLSSLPSTSTLHNPSGVLATWRSELCHELPETRDFDWTGESSRHKGKVSTAFLERLNGIFTGIENYNVSLGKALSEIYLSKLHFTLRELAGYIHIPGDRKYKFRQRAEAILTRWHTLFLLDISRPDTTVFWAMKGTRAIVFIPEGHPMRTSANALDLVYGLEGDGSFEEGSLEYERL